MCVARSFGRRVAPTRRTGTALCCCPVVLLGVQGAFGAGTGRLSSGTVEALATAELAVTEPGAPEFEALAALALDGGRPADEVEQLVGVVCEARHVDLARSRRKWRAALVADALGELDPNPLYGSVQLSEIWSSWGWPVDGPRSMQRGAAGPAADEFGSPEYFERARQETLGWLAAEFAALG